MQAAQGAAQRPPKTGRQRRSSSRIQLWAEARIPLTSRLSPSNSGKNIQVELAPATADHGDETQGSTATGPAPDQEQVSQEHPQGLAPGTGSSLTRVSSGMWNKLGTLSSVSALAFIRRDADALPRHIQTSLSTLAEAETHATDAEALPEEGEREASQLHMID